MAIPEELRKTVVFVGIKEGKKFIPKATAFLTSYAEFGLRFPHFVTAEHVISGLLTRGHDIWVRCNLESGDSGQFKLDPADMHYHPNAEAEPTDVAIWPMKGDWKDDNTGDAVKLEIKSVPLNGPSGLAATGEVLSARGAGIGDQIEIVGLFRSHYGRERNIPIVRIGHISSMRDEPVPTKYCSYIDAYLVEAMSIGGLSGSPVFVRIPGIVPAPRLFLGLMHGHFDVRDLHSDVVLEDIESQTQGIHTGIGVVIPVEKILETINNPVLRSAREEYAKRHRERDGGATADLDRSREGANENHREDFKILLNAAAKTKPQDDRT